MQCLREIPDNRASGISDTISLSEDALIAGVKVSVGITHSYRGDLLVSLATPWGGFQVLHQRQGGGARDLRRTFDESDLPDLASLRGQSTRGGWTLPVQDLAPADLGRLDRWGLELTIAAQPQRPVALEAAPGAQIPDDDPAAISSALTVSDQGRVGSVEVSVDISHTWIADAQVSLRSPAGDSIRLRDRTGGDADNIVKTYSAADTPYLDRPAGQEIRGEWLLHVADLAGQDAGKLNRWGLLIHPVCAPAANDRGPSPGGRTVRPGDGTA